MPASHLASRLLGGIALGATTLVGACGDDDAGSANEPASTAPSTVQEGPVAATAVVVGDCLNGVVIGATERAEITSAEVVSCDQPHGLEVYATFDLTAADFDLDAPAEYPGPVRVVRAADERCADEIDELVEDRERFGLIALWPSQASWAEGDRGVACAVFARNGGVFETRQL